MREEKKKSKYARISWDLKLEFLLEHLQMAILVTYYY